MDPELGQHFQNQNISYIQFAFRWILCLLIREFPLHLILRLFDTYISEDRGFTVLHVYVCCALILKFSSQLKKMQFNELIQFLQNLPTAQWSLHDLEILIQEAYVYMNMFEQTSGHIKPSQNLQWN